MAVPFDFQNPDLEAVRLIFFDWLRAQHGNLQLPSSGEAYAPFVDYIGPSASSELATCAVQVFWQLVLEGVISPGNHSQQPQLPWFQVTAYGRQVLAEAAGHPHDPSGYLHRLKVRVPNADSTVLAYLTESLATFRRGAVIAAAVMLGIAAFFFSYANRCTPLFQTAMRRRSSEHYSIVLPSSQNWIGLTENC